MKTTPGNLISARNNFIAVTRTLRIVEISDFKVSQVVYAVGR